MTTIYVTGGRSDYAVVTLSDARSANLAGATIRLGLSVSERVLPTEWHDPDLAVFPPDGTAVLSLLLDDTNTSPGQYRIWLDVVDNPTSQPVCATNDIVRVL